MQTVQGAQEEVLLMRRRGVGAGLRAQGDDGAVGEEGALAEGRNG